MGHLETLIQHLATQNPESKIKWIATLIIAISVLLGTMVVWNFEIIASISHTAWHIVAAIWEICSDFASACWGFLRWVFRQHVPT